MAVINKNLPKKSEFNKKFPIVELDPVKLDMLIETQGVRVKVYQTMLCPNVKKIDSGEHEIDCKLCKGIGFIDHNFQQTWGFIQSQTLIREFAKEGVWDDQNVACTFQTDIEVQYFAKIELMDFTTTFYELIQRQEGELDRLKYPAFSIQTLIDQHGVQYTYQKHFVLTESGDVKWINGFERPSIGTIYTIYYTYPITYRAVNAMHVNRFSQVAKKLDHKEPVQLNQQWLLKRDYLLTRQDLDGNPLKPNKNIVETTPEE